MKTNVAAVIVLSLCAFIGDAGAKDFVYAGKTMSCKDAIAYRDTSLYAEYVTAIDKFDAGREKRAAAIVKDLDKEIALLTEDLDGMDATLRKRLVLVVSGWT